ncbi:CHAT domain-containing protein [Pleurocapsales cyanobacterium LEGE 06147]|nr:CHAT domain-containing protein [Pleurocapsales cyanobacterium LEGE 06147]
MFNRFYKSTKLRFLGVLFLTSLTFCLWLGYVPSTTKQVGELVNAQTADPAQLVNQGIERYSGGDFRGAIARWQTALDVYQKSNNPASTAIVSENLARAYQQLGESEEAPNYWEPAIDYYRASGNWQQLGRMLTEQAQAYSSLGQPEKAIQLLCGGSKEKRECLPGSALQIARQQEDKLGEIAALGSLGEAYRLRGDYDEAIEYLEQAKNFQNSAYNFLVLNSLGNAHVSRAQLWNLRAKSAQQRGVPQASEFQQQATNNYKQALEYFQSSLQQARQQDNKPGEMRSLLNLIQLYYRSQAINLVDTAQISADIQQALALLDRLPDSVNKVYAAIDLANLPAVGIKLTSPLTQCSPRNLPNTQTQELLKEAIAIAQTQQNSRAESFALGALGHFYECRQEYQQALELTQKALWVADQKLKAKDSLYLWEWQAGRILQARGKTLDALPFYQRAYNTLEKIRSDILIADRDFQFDFRDIIEPIYRQLAHFQLELASLGSLGSENRLKELNSALETINSLKLAELQNYFGNDCILTALNDRKVDELIQEDTAVFSSIILEDSTAILLSLPNNKQRLHWINQKREDFRDRIEEFRESLTQGLVSINYDTTLAENLYDSIVRPLEADLKSHQIKTIVFIQDGFLRNVPMAALYDKNEKKYLIEKYAVAISPSLRLTAPKKLNTQASRALILGVSREATVDQQKFPALTSVPIEIKEVQKQFPESKQLVNKQFDFKNLEKELEKTAYPIIHIATHGQFGTIPEDTFIVAGDNSKLTINQLENILLQVSGGSNSIELLSLTACQTATGDERATLGLAGVALQVGTRSAMASLWSVGDESTADLVAEFYRKLRQPGMSKARALQAAQIKLIEAKRRPEINNQYDNPYYWAPFIIIGNWL